MRCRIVPDHAAFAKLLEVEYKRWPELEAKHRQMAQMGRKIGGVCYVVMTYDDVTGQWSGSENPDRPCADWHDLPDLPAEGQVWKRHDGTDCMVITIGRWVPTDGTIIVYSDHSGAVWACSILDFLGVTGSLAARRFVRVP